MTEDRVYTATPAGFEWAWVPESGWGALVWEIVSGSSSRQCRHTSSGERCPKQSVARLNRSRIEDFTQWWHYCEDHMYGRRIRNGIVEMQVMRPITPAVEDGAA